MLFNWLKGQPSKERERENASYSSLRPKLIHLKKKIVTFSDPPHVASLSGSLFVALIENVFNRWLATIDYSLDTGYHLIEWFITKKYFKN